MSTTQNDQSRYARLRTFNWIAAVVHSAQAVAVVVLATDFTLPVTATYLSGPPRHLGHCVRDGALRRRTGERVPRDR